MNFKSNLIAQASSANLIQKTCNNLNTKLKQGNLVLLKADKGESIAVLPRGEYNRKMVDLLSTLGSQPNPFFDFDDYNIRVRSAIHRSKLAIKRKPELLL